MIQYEHNNVTEHCYIITERSDDMNEDLITKKELLARYGISYGALYRWKRMGLIPEEWFIKRASTTGQETYFDRAAITERIEAIMSMKDKMSLEEIAAQFRAPESENKTAPPSVRFVWKYGEKNLPLDDSTGIFLVSSRGKTIDITEKIKKIAMEEFENE